MNINWAKLVPELSCTSLSASLDFYRLLGFEVLFSREGFAYLAFEGIQWMLQDARQDDWPTAAFEKPLGRGINFQIECQDVVSLRNKLLEHKVPLFRDLKENWRQTGSVLSGSKEFLVQDPDGYLLRFAEALGQKALEA